jgi:glycoside/pentoside/hexuronide:cation symporter, GPH family
VTVQAPVIGGEASADADLGGRLAWHTRLAWLVSCMPEMLKSVAWDMFVLFYYSQVIGLRGDLLGIVLALILTADALIDPYAGTVSDRLRGAWLGRRHTPMILAIVPFALGFIAVFSPPSGLGQAGIAAWLGVSGLVARLGISFYTIPALAMGAELSRDPRERTLIAMLRNIGNNLAVVFVPIVGFQLFFVATPEYPKGQLNPAPYPAYGVMITAVAVTAMVLAVLGTRRRVMEIEALETQVAAVRDEDASPGFFQEIATALRVTPNIRRMLLLVFLVLLSIATINQLSLHLSTYLWQLDARQNQVVLTAMNIGTVVGLVSAVGIVRRFEKRTVMLSGLLGFLAFGFASIAAPLAGLAPHPGSAGIGWFVAACRFVGGLAYGCYLVPLGAVILDIADEHEANTGRPQQGLVSAAHFFGLQAASAIVGLSAGFFLYLIEFPTGLKPDEMPWEKIRSLALFVLAVIVIVAIGLAVVIRRLDVSAEKQVVINARLKALRK